MVLDNDKGGKDAAQHYKKEFEFANIKNKIFKLNEIIKKNYIKAIESIIPDEDKKRICDFAGIKYNESNNKVSLSAAIKNLVTKYYSDKKNFNNRVEDFKKLMSVELKNNCECLSEFFDNFLN